LVEKNIYLRPASQNKPINLPSLSGITQFTYVKGGIQGGEEAVTFWLEGMSQGYVLGGADGFDNTKRCKGSREERIGFFGERKWDS